MNYERGILLGHEPVLYRTRFAVLCVRYILTEGVFPIAVYSISGLCSKSHIFLLYLTRRLIAVACAIHKTGNPVQRISAFRKSSLSALTNERLIFHKSNISLSYVFFV